MFQEQDSSTPLTPSLATRRTSLAAASTLAERQAGEADHPLRVVLAEVDDEIVVDAQHLVRRFGIAELCCGCGEDAVDHLGVDAVLVELLGAQIGIAEETLATLADSFIKTGLVHAVGAVLLAEVCMAPAGRHRRPDQTTRRYGRPIPCRSRHR